MTMVKNGEKIIFLDIDGVLNATNDNYPALFSPKCVEQFKRVMREAPGTQIVLSTSWREGIRLLRLGWVWCHHGLADHWIIGRTPSLPFDSRGEEIMTWIDESGMLYGMNESTRWAVLEDVPDWIFPDIPKENAFICNPEKGLTKRLATRLIQFLNGENEMG